jgi:tRNA 2-selenouridine synthase
VAIVKIEAEEFLKLSEGVVVLDVRSPGEYSHARIPGAVSLPLFTDAERATIGTAYKQRSRQVAVKIGLSSFGANLVPMVEAAEKIVQPNTPGRSEVIVHCWRGGMRSGAVAWLLDLYGFKVYQLAGGYKSWRKWALAQLDKDYPLRILSGYTGSNKTGVIQAMIAKKIPAIDLEQLAGHKGSSFGNLDMVPQPSQEQFENLLAHQLWKTTNAHPGQAIWLEAESQRIGLVNIPFGFFNKMRAASLLFLDINFEERLNFIVRDYGIHDRDKIINGIVRIKKKLGGVEAKEAMGCLMDDDLRGCFAVLLRYYDRLYLKSTGSADRSRPAYTIGSATTDASVNLTKILSDGNAT